MFLFITLVCAALAVYLPSKGLSSDTPISAITLGMLFSLGLRLFLYAAAFQAFMKSLDADRIWPWRWTLPYLGNLCIRGSIIAFILYALDDSYADLIKKYPQIVIFAVTLCAILFVMFSSELELLQEKKKEDDKPKVPLEW